MSNSSADIRIHRGDAEKTEITRRKAK